ncbi:hypothetical protein FB567DRAFT_51569 [Paraphoma chrysanthemicola]|uniref:Ubiquitin-like domain-containing protein n=1 Tax=Paraphoma chrysanthemicola TaxID=798071 RepID=A0A8K0VY41_9PLEO|nr:hypothetical protein FB567DRAFT_51569 [Paraphoma chrysanthemicola]
MPVTFGSVGDLIAVCLLVKDCVEALSDSNGSSAEYKAVVRELYILEKALLEIGVLSQTQATTPELVALFTSADATVDQCRKLLESFKAKIQPYDKQLGSQSTSNSVQKVCNGSARKLLWQVRMKDEVTRFRAEVVAHSVSIGQLLAAATMHTVKAQSDKLESRIGALQQQNQRSFDNQDDMLKTIRTRLDEVDQRLSAGNNLILKLAAQARKTWLLQLGNELKALMFRTMAMNLVIYASVDKIQNSIMDLSRNLTTLSPITPITHEQMFYLRDPLGRVSAITLSFITSYDALTAVLQVRFQGMPGQKKILRKEFALQNRATGRDVDVTQRWESIFLPGLWYDMDMIFQITNTESADDANQDACPRCNEKSNQPQGLKIKCSVCNQEYQIDRVTEVVSDAAATSGPVQHTLAPDAPDSFVNAPLVAKDLKATLPIAMGPDTPRNEKDEDDDPANFNHVRIKTRKAQPVPSERDSAEAQEDDSITDPQTHEAMSEGSGQGDGDYVEDSPQISPETRPLTTLESDTTTAEIDTHQNKEDQSQPSEEIPSDRESTKTVSTEGEASRRRKSKVKKPAKATEEDARRAGIPSGYSYRNWDPEEEPIMLLGSVFDANSLGKWIYDWTVFCHGPSTPLTELAGELWLLLIQLAGKIKRAESVIGKIKNQENCELVEDFFDSGERLWMRLVKVLKTCEEYMYKAMKKDENGVKKADKNTGREFVDTMFGKDRELEKTEKLMAGMRLWSLRFDACCDQILRQPSAPHSLG